MTVSTRHHRARGRRGAALLVAVAGLGSLAACSQASQTVSGVLSSPSGLAYVERPSSVSLGSGFARLFIADAEAGGVRVVNLSHSVTSTNTATAASIDGASFVVAPVVFFPLVIPADGYPTALAASKDGDRLYVLSPATKVLHVLDIHEPKDASDETYVPLGDIPLGALGGPSSTPAALVTVGASDVADFLAIAVDSGGEGSSLLVGLTIDRAIPGVGVSKTVTTTIADGPRSLLVRKGSVDGAGAIVASSAASPLAGAGGVSLVRTTTASGSLAFEGASTIDVGGPTSLVADYGRYGFVAFRLDRPSAIAVEAIGDTYARSTDFFFSPFTPVDERGAPETAGRIDLRVLPVAAATYGVVPNASIEIGLSSTIPLVENSTVGDTIAMAHVDGQVSFLAGPKPNLRVQRASVATLAVESSSSLLRVGTGFCTYPGDATEAATCATASPTTTNCVPGVIGDQQIFAETLRATYQGTLATSRLASVQVAATSTSGATALRITDPEVDDFTLRQVRPGDGVLVQGSFHEGCAASGAIVPVVVTASVATVEGPQTILLRPTRAPVFAGCGADAPALATKLKYEVFAEGREFVVARIEGTRPVLVFDRVPVQPKTAALQGALNITVTLGSGFSCALHASDSGSGGVESGSVCSSSNDCATGVCNQLADACFGRCNACAETDTTCLPNEVIRWCPALVVTTNPAVASTVPLGTSLTGGVAVTAPAEVVFSPMRRSFFISSPGGRVVDEIWADLPNHAFAERVPELR